MYENVPAVSAVERQQVLAALERLQTKLTQKEEWGHSQTLGALRDTLQRPLLAHILTLQHSVRQLRDQLNNLPADSCSDFSFSRKGQLIVSLAPPTTSSLQAPPPLSSVLPPPPQASVLANESTSLSPEQLQRWIQSVSKDQVVEVVNLSRPSAGGLGFSVAALRSEGTQRGFFIKHIQPGGVAHRDGRLKEMDQILVMNGSPLDPEVSQQQALSLLQQPTASMELLVARERPPHTSPPPQATPPAWGHVEEVELVNDGSGLGFGIVGGRTSGVVVRTLVPNSVADKDGRLRTGDHILRIGATPTGGLSSDQVVRVLQGCGSRVTMLIARDPCSQSPATHLPPPPPSSAPVSAPPTYPPNLPLRRVSKTPNLEGYEVHDVCLSRKAGQSLGISIIGYNALTSQDAVGVFVKHVVPGSAADQSGNIRVHDRLIALDGVSLQGFTNQEVLEVMKEARQEVQLSLIRKTRTLERSLDRVERESSRVSLKRSLEVKTRSSDLNRTTATSSLAPEPPHTTRTPRDEELSSEQDVKSKWEQALGPQYHVMIVELDPVIEDDAELQKYSKLLPIHTMRLGVELDSFDGHHYVSSVAPGGPMETHGLIRPEDELLEVNGVQLYGKSRREAVAFLREVPPPFTLVCCRHHDLQDRDQEDHEDQDHGEPEPWRTTPNVEEIELKLSSLLSSKTEVKDKQQDPPAPPLSSRPQEEEEEEEEGELALWSPDIQVLELQKESDRGLGFSILDYQDPVDPGSCVMVIRSLVAGGAAESQGCLLPGDQLVWVNQTQLDRLSLAQAVEVLKAAPPGPVRLGIRKPLVATEGESFQTPSERWTDIPSLDRLSVSVTNTLPVPKGFGDGSILPEDLREATREEEEEELEERELILDGGLPRYSSLVTSDLLGREGLEMTVDDVAPPPHYASLSAPQSWGEEEEQQEMKNQEEQDSQTPGTPLLSLSGSRDIEADSELTLTDTDTESRRVVDTGRRKRRGQAGTASPIRGDDNYLPEREDGEGEETPAFSHWGPPRRVEVWLEPTQALGISIVGGRHVIKRLRNGEELRGIFIKQVLPDSPAAQTHCLKTGDKILEVSGVDLQAASHQEAVQAIKSAESPVVFTVQSLSNTPRPVSVTASSYIKHRAKRTPPSKAAVAPPSARLPPPYRPPSQSEREMDPVLLQTKGQVA